MNFGALTKLQAAGFKICLLVSLTTVARAVRPHFSGQPKIIKSAQAIQCL
jgi:hypothetical protein